ncbi:MAG: helix-turn-helix domain-containing protein [Novosphingobium sp.]
MSARLRAARVAAGLSLADIAARTRIAARYLEAIEEGRFGDLASHTYVIGFARAYARTVGLEEREIAAAVRAELAAGEGPPRPHAVTFEPGDPARVPRPRLAWLAAFGALAVALAVIVLWRSFYSPEASLNELVPGPSATGSVAAVLPQAKAPSAAVAAAAAGPVAFTALEANIWVRFTDGSGKRLMEKQMALGESFTIPADADGPKVRTGRPDALRITVGGREVPRLAAKPVNVKDVPVSAAALLARPGASGGMAPAPASSAPSASPSAPAN